MISFYKRILSCNKIIKKEDKKETKIYTRNEAIKRIP